MKPHRKTIIRLPEAKRQEDPTSRYFGKFLPEEAVIEGTIEQSNLNFGSTVMLSYGFKCSSCTLDYSAINAIEGIEEIEKNPSSRYYGKILKEELFNGWKYDP